MPKIWREEDPVIGDDGQVKQGGMFEHQRTWWNLPNFVRLLVGGYGCGKTIMLCKHQIALALHNAPAPAAIVSPSFPMASETVDVQMHNLLAGKASLFEGFRWEHNQSRHVYRMSYHGRLARVIVYSGEYPDRLKGPNLGSAAIDEPFIQEEATFVQMNARVRHPRARIKCIDLGGTPEQLNWGYRLVHGNLAKKHDVGYVRADTRANLALTPDYAKRQLSAMDDKTAAAYVRGEFVNLGSGLVYYAFVQGNNVKTLEMPEDAELGCGMDFNVDPMAFLIFWHVESPVPHLHIMREYELPNADTEYAAQVAMEAFPRLRHVYPDATGRKRDTKAPGGKTDFHFLEQAGLRVETWASNPRRRDRYNAVNGALKDRGLGLGPMLTIEPRCEHLIEYLQTYSHELMPKQKALSHLLDALGYPIAFLYPVDKGAFGVYRVTGTY